MNISNFKKIGFYVYSYYQARDILSVSRNFQVVPFIFFKYYLINNFGTLWVCEIFKLLIKDFDKNQFKIVLDCKKNPALAVNCIRYGFSCIKFDGNSILQKKIKSIGNKHKVLIKPKIRIIDLKRIKNCNKYTLEIMNNYKKKKKNEY